MTATPLTDDEIGAIKSRLDLHMARIAGLLKVLKHQLDEDYHDDASALAGCAAVLGTDARTLLAELERMREERESFRFRAMELMRERDAAVKRAEELAKALREAVDFAEGVAVGHDVPRFFRTEAVNVSRLRALVPVGHWPHCAYIDCGTECDCAGTCPTCEAQEIGLYSLIENGARCSNGHALRALATAAPVVCDLRKNS